MHDNKPVCMICRHYYNWEVGGMNCKAFPDGIPDEILEGGDPHSKPLKDQDNDIVFDNGKPGAKEALEYINRE